ncbi:MAG: hypothetical protein HOQ05_02275 [Corynebacteriales bacterium]|nr:hypothetical protein [Mycobacteriales bacterium]
MPTCAAPTYPSRPRHVDDPFRLPNPARHLLPATDRLGSWTVRRISWIRRLLGVTCATCTAYGVPKCQPARYRLGEPGYEPINVCAKHLYAPPARRVRS